ncbi:polyprenyl synthetase family protein [Micromonospora sp. b486]|uniref:polyprenyl synthetase family protein n=1 Tax=Micromonospora sp. b486 TaxID=3053986 RepID=UPI00259CC803|nr:polyprenyl synthetase family protein [Micromonospora sp. b486]MDM4784692.1 polyprenyl synthetase family protein [Micromonospora sp. b486]
MGRPAQAHAAVPADRLLDVRRCYDQMRVETVAGQFLDVLGRTTRRAGPSTGAAGGPVQDRQLHRPASAAVRRLPGRRRRRRPTHRRVHPVRLAVGEAFQLRDDLLGVYGDPATTASRPGTDLRTGKPTALLMLDRQLADPAQRRALDRAGSVTSAHEGARLADVVRDTGATAQVERMISERVTEALAALRTAPIDETARTALTGLATAATARRA